MLLSDVDSPGVLVVGHEVDETEVGQSDGAEASDDDVSTSDYLHLSQVGVDPATTGHLSGELAEPMPTIPEASSSKTVLPTPSQIQAPPKTSKIFKPSKHATARCVVRPFSV